MVFKGGLKHKFVDSVPELFADVFADLTGANYKAGADARNRVAVVAAVEREAGTGSIAHPYLILWLFLI